jgi:hypothetical protein
LVPRRVGSFSAWASALAFFLTGLFPFFNADGYGHLAQGRQIAALGRVPKVDSFSFWRSAPQSWTNYEWAYDWVSWLVYDHLGATALVLIKCIALAGLGFALVSLAYRLAAARMPAGALALSLLLIVLPIARFRFTVRPQIIGLVFPAALLLGIGAFFEADRSRKSKALILTALTLMHLAWVNAHGSHLLGLSVGLIFLVFSWRTSAFRWMGGLVALQLLAMGCTPFGFSIVTDAISHVAQPAFRSAVTEWSPWSPSDPLRLLLGPTASSVLVLIALRPVARSGRFGVGYAVFCVLLCVMAFRSTRFVAHQVLFTTPFAAAGIAQRRPWRSLRAGLAPIVAIAIGVNAVWTAQLVPAFGFGVGEARRDYPWASADVIARSVEHPRILATIQDSWALMFALPKARFLVDGRVPFYGPEFIARVTNSFGDEETFATLIREFDVNTVLVDHTRADHAAATRTLIDDPAWGLVFVDRDHSLYVRADAARSVRPLRIVGPGFRTGRMLDDRVSDAQVDAEIERLRGDDLGGPIEAWLVGLRSLRPLARDGDRAGIRKAANAEEKRRAHDAYAALSEAAAAYPGFTSIELYRAMAALSVCEIDEARRALARARHAGETRETAMVALEIALQSKDETARAAARAHLAELQARAETHSDPWVLALSSSPDRRCP